MRKIYIDNSGNRYINSQNSLMDNSEKRIPNNRIIHKKGIFFSADALIALAIIIVIILIAFPLFELANIKTNIHEDTLVVLSSLKIGEIDNSKVKSWIDDGIINNTDRLIIEQLGEFYVQNRSMARELAEIILNDTRIAENIGIWYNGELLGSKNTSSYESSTKVDVARQIISGIGGLQEGGATGYSARAYLTSASKVNYFYFGGYVGDGNISILINYNGTITNASMELAINNDFNLFVNGADLGLYTGSPNETNPVKYNVPIGNFLSGDNILEFKGNKLHIAGGFVKINYELNTTLEQSNKHYFPGIKGLINIYDGFYIPGNLTSLNINLHLNSSYRAFLNIGNKSVWNGTTNGEQSFAISNNTLGQILNYDEISKKTIPLRLGLENATYAVNVSLDIISVADLSKSMACSVAGSNCGNGPNQCNSCGGIWRLPINKSIDSHFILIERILDLGSSRLGIKGYEVSVPTSGDQPLTNDSNLLTNKINRWHDMTLSSQNRKLCLAIQDTVNDFQVNSQPENIKIAIVMGAGDITHDCSGVISGDLNLNGNADDPGDDAIKVACDAHDNSGIIFYSVGYGDNADVQTLQKIAQCGNGTFYSSDISGLPELYDKIVNDIIAQYKLQTIDFSSTNVITRLYPDSFIEYNYISEQIPAGLLLTQEKQFDSSSEGSFNIPLNSTIVETKVISYSGPSWTDKVFINNTKIYDLSAFGSSYINLGDPYVVNIPGSYIQGDNYLNYVNLTLGNSPANTTSGSIHNKIIYTFAKEFSAYSDIVQYNNGCNWNLTFEDNSNVILKVPSNYIGVENCVYDLTFYNDDDAAKIATYSLLKAFDFDLDGKIDYKFDNNDLKIELTQTSGMPFVATNEIQVRVWR